MKTESGIVAALLLLAISVFSLAVAGEGRGVEPVPPNDFTVGDILERIERYQRNGLRDAEQWHAGLKRMNTAAAYLEMALLEVYGPEPVLDRDRGLERMMRLQRGEIGPFSADIRRLFGVLATQAEASMAAEQECRALAGRLAEEQREHRETRSKLEALRMIERQLETPGDEPEFDHEPH